MWSSRCASATIGLMLGIATFSAGCGGGKGTGPGPIATSVPGNKRISDLTPAERGQFCADIAEWAMSGPFLTDGCNLDAWVSTSLQASLDTTATDADLRATCSALYSECVANGVTSTCDTSAPSTCTATVSEFDTCLVDTVDVLGSVPDCSALTRASAQTEITAISTRPLTAACMAVQAKCPQ
jgi:hypothetical protein